MQSLVFVPQLNATVALLNENELYPNGPSGPALSVVALQLSSNATITPAYGNHAEELASKVTIVLTSFDGYTYLQQEEVSPGMLAQGARYFFSSTSSSLQLLPADLGVALTCELVGVPPPIARGSCVSIQQPAGGETVYGLSLPLVVTDDCQTAPFTAASLSSAKSSVAPVCRFSPMSQLSFGAISLNVSSGEIVVVCPMPLWLGPGVYQVQLSLDGGASFPLQPIGSAAANSSRLTVVEAQVVSSAPPAPAGVLNLSLLSNSSGNSPLPFGFNAGNILNVSWSFAQCGSQYMHIALMADVMGSGTSPALQMSSLPVAFLSYNQRCRAGWVLWTAPNISAILQSLSIDAAAQLLSLSMQTFFTPSSIPALSSLLAANYSGSSPHRRLLKLQREVTNFVASNVGAGSSPWWQWSPSQWRCLRC